MFSKKKEPVKKTKRTAADLEQVKIYYIVAGLFVFFFSNILTSDSYISVNQQAESEYYQFAKLI